MKEIETRTAAQIFNEAPTLVWWGDGGFNIGKVVHFTPEEYKIVKRAFCDV